MPRVPISPPESIPDDLRFVLDRVGDAHGFVPNSMLTMGHHPGLLRAFSALATEVMGDTSSIPGDLRWLIAHLASRAAGCRYCIAHTAHNGASAAGLGAEKVDAAWDFERSDVFTDGERAALRLAAAGATVPNEATDEMFDELRQHFDDGQIVDIVAVIALFGFLNRWNDTMATGLEEAPTAFGEQHLAAHGWDAGKHAL